MSRRSFVRTGVVLGAGAAVLGSPIGWWPGGRAEAATTIASCSTWGAQPPTEPITVLSSQPNKIIVHHTASANSTDYSLAHAYQLARNIQASHFSRGFIDSGQHFTISRGGYVLEGRHRSLEILRAGRGHVVSAHCSGQNDQAIGIENEGTYISVAPPAILYDQLVTLCADICLQFGISPNQIYGHRDFNATQCPGDMLYARLPTLRTDVAARTRAWPTARRPDSGERVRTVQYLLRASGASVTVDGAFGPGTESAVKSFQQAQGLPVTGAVTSNTWERLVVTVRNGSTGEAVKAVQSQLNTRGYGLTMDGAFGSLTEAAVRDFQSRAGLVVDGVVGPNTWLRLVDPAG